MADPKRPPCIWCARPTAGLFDVLADDGSDAELGICADCCIDPNRGVPTFGLHPTFALRDAIAASFLAMGEGLRDDPSAAERWGLTTEDVAAACAGYVSVARRILACDPEIQFIYDTVQRHFDELRRRE